MFQVEGAAVDTPDWSRLPLRQCWRGSAMDKGAQANCPLNLTADVYRATAEDMSTMIAPIHCRLMLEQAVPSCRVAGIAAFHRVGR